MDNNILQFLNRLSGIPPLLFACENFIVQILLKILSQSITLYIYTKAFYDNFQSIMFSFFALCFQNQKLICLFTTDDEIPHNVHYLHKII